MKPEDFKSIRNHLFGPSQQPDTPPDPAPDTGSMRETVATETGAPAELLRGQDIDELRAHAQELITARQSWEPAAPVVEAQGKSPQKQKLPENPLERLFRGDIFDPPPSR